MAKCMKAKSKRMETLPLFDQDRDCPKCGASEALTKYCGRATPSEPCWKGLGDAQGQREHLHRRCLRCDYVWFEQCLPSDGLEVLQIVRRPGPEPEYVI